MHEFPDWYHRDYEEWWSNGEKAWNCLVAQLSGQWSVEVVALCACVSARSS